MAVCGDPQARHGIILSKNELAKAAGVKDGGGHLAGKGKVSGTGAGGHGFSPPICATRKRCGAIYADFSDRVEPFGLDEAWLDVSDVGAEAR